MSLTCPKCQGAMRSYERNGVTVDQCTECRGVFLDRGELEHLVDAESRWNAGHDVGAGGAGRPGAAPSQGPGYGAGAPGHPGAGSAVPPGAPHPGAPASGAAASGGGLGAMVGEVLRQAGSARSGHGSPSGYGSSGYGSSYGSNTPKRKKSFLDELFG